VTVREYTVTIRETYADEFDWTWHATFSGSRPDIAMRRALAYNGRLSRANLVKAHGAFVRIKVEAR
jgi:hypothetical protein